MYYLTYKSVDVMKKSKDSLTGQLTTAEKTNLVACLKTMGITHISISVPMDVQATWTGVGSTPSSRTVSAETQDWCDVIHAAELNVIHRGTFGGAENIFSVPYIDGGKSTGTAASASTDGSTTLCGMWYQYLNTNVGTSHVVSGDVFSPVPEGTTHAFDGHYFWSGGSQANYVDVYQKWHTIMTTFATAAGVSLTFMSHNNLSEVASGWMPSGIFSDQSLNGFDYYGQRPGSAYVNVSNYVTGLQNIYLGHDVDGTGNNSAGGYDQFWGEWGDLPGAMPAYYQRTPEAWGNYLIQFYKGLRDNLISPNGHLTGFNYWGGWEGQNTSLLWKTGSGASSQYFLNFRGQILAAFFKNPGGMTRMPAIVGGTSNDTYYF